MPSGLKARSLAHWPDIVGRLMYVRRMTSEREFKRAKTSVGAGPAGSKAPSSPTVTPATTRPKRTPEEQAILDLMAETDERGREWVEKNAELILDQAREFGNL